MLLRISFDWDYSPWFLVEPRFPWVNSRVVALSLRACILLVLLTIVNSK